MDGTISAIQVGRDVMSLASHQKLLSRNPCTALDNLRCGWLALTCQKASRISENKPRALGIAMDIDQSSSKILCHCLVATTFILGVHSVQPIWDCQGWHIRTQSCITKSATVSVAAQNAGGDSDHPIGSTKGIAINYWSPFLVGNKTPSQIESLGFKFIR